MNPDRWRKLMVEAAKRMCPVQPKFVVDMSKLSCIQKANLRASLRKPGFVLTPMPGYMIEPIHPRWTPPRLVPDGPSIYRGR